MITHIFTRIFENTYVPLSQLILNINSFRHAISPALTHQQRRKPSFLYQYPIFLKIMLRGAETQPTPDIGFSRDPAIFVVISPLARERLSRMFFVSNIDLSLLLLMFCLGSSSVPRKSANALI